MAGREAAWAMLLGALLLAGGRVHAQPAFPARPIQIVNPAPAGSISDTLLRALAPGLQAKLGQPVAVVNRDGASGALGTATVARAAPDGYTLLFTAAYTLSVLPVTRPDAGYRAEQIEPVCRTFVNTMALAVRPESPFTSLGDLVAAARAQPGSLRFGHQGIASIPHLAMVELAQAAGIQVQDVPYRGEPAAILDAMAGRVEFVSLVLGSLRGGALRPLAVFAERRHPLIPDVPTVPEAGFPVAPTSFGGLLAPAGLPVPVRQTLARACAGAAAEEVYAEAARRGFQPLDYYADTEEFGRALRRDVADKARLLATVEVPR
ncbi:tripartite tricarboxylate transporter substrate binding protein [Siccirubricoccus sp. G192]|uniref:tripartite tricarboxylate transporter substrate binding protein n=1 Tax=Siccirubricoccus sp. G192 TaxID=2849651 RepID=UPI001C2C61CF|nr:tripartite tricarboxylate transporter substrate binding protein [Siccirubricoccus sp. G192]MBV1798465.1 tripartite tricarboxylate transporter substrate binding protein [Siccirubricoccus sp. G192]